MKLDVVLLGVGLGGIAFGFYMGAILVKSDTNLLLGGFFAAMIFAALVFPALLSLIFAMFDISLGEIFKVMRRKPYYKFEYFIDEDNRKLGSEIFPVAGQEIIESKRFKDKSFYIPKSYHPDVLGLQRRIKYYVDNAFPIIDNHQYYPSVSHEILTEVEIAGPETIETVTQDPFTGRNITVKEPVITRTYKAIRSDFLKIWSRERSAKQIMAEPVDKWAQLVPVLVLAIIVAGVLIFFGVIWPNMHIR